MYVFHRFRGFRWGYGFRVPLIVLLLIVLPAWLAFEILKAARSLSCCATPGA